jgi:dTDP-4-dehydrorhamnose reductase
MRVVIVGADGLIGNALHASLRRRGHSVLGTTRRTDKAGYKGGIFLDLSESTLPSIPPADVAIICAAMSRFADCRNYPDRARHVNVLAPLMIAKQIGEKGGRVLLLSSSVVFDCRSPHAMADQPTAPRSAYGRLKAEAEAGILAIGGTVLRLTKVVAAGTGRLADWVSALEQGQIVRAFEDHRFCPIKLDSALDAVAAIAEQRSSGVFQLSGAEDISYADAARHLTDRMGIPRDRVEGALAVDNGVPEDEVTPYTSLDTSRLSALSGYRPLSPRKVIDDVFAASFATARTP